MDKIIKNTKKYKTYIILVIIFFLSLGSIVIKVINKNNNIKVNSNIVEKGSKNGKIGVYITGAIKNPGVYYINENSRLCDLLDICGGVEENADIEKMNLAQKLNDSDKITILKKVDQVDNLEKNDANEEKSYDNPSSKININTATKEELMGLSGIGNSTADKIIEYRKTRFFTSIEELMNIPGIGNSKFEKLKERIDIN
ncbi:MAG: ComEA family DNA-binding protein [Clostridia bacterium]